MITICGAQKCEAPLGGALYLEMEVTQFSSSVSFLKTFTGCTDHGG